MFKPLNIPFTVSIKATAIGIPLSISPTLGERAKLICPGCLGAILVAILVVETKLLLGEHTVEIGLFVGDTFLAFTAVKGAVRLMGDKSLFFVKTAVLPFRDSSRLIHCDAIFSKRTKRILQNLK